MGLRIDGMLEQIKPTANKAAEQAIRLAAVMELIANPKSDKISLINMENAIELENWYLEEARLNFQQSSSKSKLDKIKHFVEWSAQWKKGVFSKGDAKNYAWGGNEVRDQASSLIDFLIKYNWVVDRSSINPETGRINTKYELNLNIKNDYATYANLLESL